MQDEKQIIDFLRTQIGVSFTDFLRSKIGLSQRESINVNTRIWRDLGVDGNDAVELLYAFSQKFNVNIDQFPFGDYFGPEAGFNPIASLWHAFFGKKFKFKELTVSDLVKAAKNGILR
jgi:hypothetical protein